MTKVFPRPGVRVSTEELAERQQFLMRHPPFQFLPGNEIEIAAANLAPETHAPGRILFFQEETRITHILIVNRGRLERIIEKEKKTENKP